MISYSQSKAIQIEITRRCPLECPKCSRQKDKGKYTSNVDLPVEFIENFLKNNSYEYIHLCGKLGDPIYHSDALNFIKMCKQYCKKMRLNTNGSGKKLTWWQDYYDIISDTDETVFGIDGLEDTSNQYRINQDWKSSFDALKLGAKLGKTVIWQWIPFSFNEHQIDEARALANRYNIPFMILKSSRWKPNDELMPTNRNLYVDYFENYDI